MIERLGLNETLTYVQDKLPFLCCYASYIAVFEHSV